MNRSRLVVSICMACMIGLILSGGVADAASTEPPPDIKVMLSLVAPPSNKIYYPGPDPANPTPINMNISLVNEGQTEIMKKEWMNTDFWLLLQFFDERGTVITSDVIRESTTLVPPPPRVFPDENGVLIQGTLVELLITGWSVSFDYDAFTYYPLKGRSGQITARAVVPASTFLEYRQTESGTKYSPRFPTDKVKWADSLKSNTISFTLVGDVDNDSYCYPVACDATNPSALPDCDDTNASVNPGAAEIANNGRDDDCNPDTPDVVMTQTGTVRVQVDKHVVQTGGHPGSSKIGLEDVDLRVYSKAEGSCVRQYGVSWHHYQSIWLGCDEVAGAGTTGIDGQAELTVAVGDHILIGRFDDPADGKTTYMGVSVGLVEVDAVVDKYLQLIIKADKKKVPGKATRRKGSDLWIIEPEYVEWSGTQELYPIIFESVGDWSVTTSVTPPEGFVVDNSNLSEEVNTELEAVQFTITDVGSDWGTPTVISHEISHKKKKEKIKSKVDFKLSKELADEKKLTIYGKNKDKDKNKNKNKNKDK